MSANHDVAKKRQTESFIGLYVYFICHHCPGYLQENQLETARDFFGCRVHMTVNNSSAK